MNKRRALGKGLGSILPEPPPSTGEGEIRYISTESIVPNRHQPRQTFGEEDLAALAESIRREGVLLPVLVRESNGGYEMVAGERRWRAALKAGLQRIPAQVKNIDDRSALELAMVENLQRQDLDPIEEARGYADMAESFSYTQEEIASIVGRSRPAVANALRLLKLPVDIQAQLKSGLLTRGHARTLLALDDSVAMRQLAERFVKESMSVRSAESEVRRAGRPGSRKEPATQDPNVRAAQERLQGRLGTMVRIHCSARGKGKIEIQFNSHDELSRLFDGIIAGRF